MTARPCAWCEGEIPARARRDALTCSKRCRQARHRVAAAVGDASCAARAVGERVAAWMRGARPHATARFALNAWEPVIYVPVARRPGDRHATGDVSRADPRLQARRVDVLSHGVTAMRTLPGRVIGAKPAVFCRWMFDLIGAEPADTLDDLFPGSGIVGRAWRAYVSSAPADAT